MDISPEQIVVTEQTFEPSLREKVVGWVQEHPVLSLGLFVGAAYYLTKGRRK